MIFSGKQLNQNEKSFSEYGIVNGSSIHLFPKPALPVATAVSDIHIPRGNVIGISDNDTYAEPADQERLDILAHHLSRQTATDMYVDQSIPEVRLWCYILFFSSFMTLFNNVSLIVSTGKLIFYFYPTIFIFLIRSFKI